MRLNKGLKISSVGDLTKVNSAHVFQNWLDVFHHPSHYVPVFIKSQQKVNLTIFCQFS
jgi:hypothetical protein